MRSFLFFLCLMGCSAAQAQPVPYKPKIHNMKIPEATSMPILPPPIEVTTPSLSLLEAIQLAYRYQSNLQVNQAQIEIASGRERQAAAGRNPKVTLTSSFENQLFNHNAFSPDFGSALISTGWNHGATLSQLLYDFGYTNETVRSARETKKSAVAALEEYRSQLVLLVSRAYYEVLQTDRLVEVQQANVVNRQHHIQQARSRFEAGLGLPSDVTRAETALASSAFNLSQAQTDSASRRLQFNQALGLDPRIRLELRPEPESPKVYESADDLYELARQRRQEIARYRSAVAAAEASLGAAHVENLPTLSTSLVYSNRQSPYQESLMANLNIQFNALDGGARSGKIQEMEGALKQARAQLAGAEQRVLTEVSQAYLNLKNAEKQITAAVGEEENAIETLRLQEGRYRAGLGIFIDVLDAQSALLLAQTNRVNAATSLNIARAALDQATGESAPQQGLTTDH